MNDSQQVSKPKPRRSYRRLVLWIIGAVTVFPVLYLIGLTCIMAILPSTDSEAGMFDVACGPMGRDSAYVRTEQSDIVWFETDNLFRQYVRKADCGGFYMTAGKRMDGTEDWDLVLVLDGKRYESLDSVGYVRMELCGADSTKYMLATDRMGHSPSDNSRHYCIFSLSSEHMAAFIRRSPDLLSVNIRDKRCEYPLNECFMERLKARYNLLKENL